MFKTPKVELHYQPLKKLLHHDNAVDAMYIPRRLFLGSLALVEVLGLLAVTTTIHWVTHYKVTLLRHIIQTHSINHHSD